MQSKPPLIGKTVQWANDESEVDARTIHMHANPSTLIITFKVVATDDV